MGDSGYTAVPPGFISRSDLSWTAKGIFLYYLSQPDGHVPSFTELASMDEETNPAEISEAYHELVTKGLLP